VTPSPFARLYEEHVWRVYGFLAYRTGDRASAEDLTQTNFERALRAWPRYDNRRASEATWLLTIAANAFIDHQRRDRSGLHEPVEAAGSIATPGPEERLTGSPDLGAALAQLSDREREVIALRYGADLSGAEVAALLCLNLANVQQISSRALRRLRELLPDAHMAPRK